MQPKGEAPKNRKRKQVTKLEDFKFSWHGKAACCCQYYNIECACDSLCWEKLHCRYICSFKIRPYDCDYYYLYPREYSLDKEHIVPSLLKLSFKAVNHFKFDKYCLPGLIEQVEYLLSKAKNARLRKLHIDTK